MKKIKYPFCLLFLVWLGSPVLTLAGPPPNIPIPVEASKPTSRHVARTLITTGTLLPFDSAQIASDIPGRITNIHFQSGTQVKANQLLIELDNITQQAELSKAEAEVIQTQAKTERILTLFDKGTGSQQDKEVAIANLAVVKAQAQIAKANFAKTQITAPFSGIIGLKDVSPGDYVTPGETLVNLEDISQLKVDFYLPQVDAASVKVGQKIQITVDAYPDKTFQSFLSAIDPMLDITARRLHGRSIVQNAEGLLKPGMFVRLSLVLEEKDNALTIPEEAILLEKTQAFVYILEDQHAKKVPVNTGKREEGWVEILTGLTPDNFVITSGLMRVQDGTLVNNIIKTK